MNNKTYPLKILLIEDNPQDVAFIRNILDPSQYELVSVTELSQGLPLLKNFSFNLILLDLTLPDSEGLETLMNVNRKFPNLPIIIFTVSNAEGIEMKAIASGAQDYLVKGKIDEYVLSRAIHYAIERKQMEEKLRQSENIYRIMVEYNQIGMLMINSDYKIIMVNNAISQLFDKPKEYFTAKRCFEEFEKNGMNCLQCPGIQAMKQNESTSVESEIIKSDGSRIYVLNQAFPTYNCDGKINGFIEIVQDITERKKIEEDLKIYKERLQKVTSHMNLIEEKQKRDIALKIHDEISQSLAFVKLKLGMIGESDSLEEIRKSIQILQTLNSQIIQKARELTLELSPNILYDLGLNPAIEWLIEDLRKKKEIDFIFEVRNFSDIQDKDRSIVVFQSIREILNNIIKHSHATKGKIKITGETKNIEIIIEDNGTGFNASPENLLDLAQTHFGLFSVREKIGNLGGLLEIRSSKDQGTSVTFKIPTLG